MVVTIADVAEKAGVGIGTVSRVVNGGAHVREDTRARVEAAMRALDYHPNAQARNLKRQTIAAIGFLFMSEQRQMSDPFFSRLMAGMADAAGDLEYDLHVVSCRHPHKELATLERLIRGNHVGGIVLTDTRLNDARVDLLDKRHFPYMAFGRTQTDPQGRPSPFVDVDGSAGVQRAVAHLAGQGHTRIGFIGLPEHLMCAQDRRLGFYAGMAQARLAADEALVVVGGLSEAEGQRAAEQLLQSEAPPSALMCCSDVLAFGAMRAISQRGWQVGREVALVGFDDVPLAAHVSPPLTTVNQPIYEIGREVVGMLVRRMRGEPVQSRLIEPELIIRQSTQSATIAVQ